MLLQVMLGEPHTRLSAITEFVGPWQARSTSLRFVTSCSTAPDLSTVSFTRNEHFRRMPQSMIALLQNQLPKSRSLGDFSEDNVEVAVRSMRQLNDWKSNTHDTLFLAIHASAAPDRHKVTEFMHSKPIVGERNIIPQNLTSSTTPYSSA